MFSPSSFYNISQTSFNSEIQINAKGVASPQPDASEYSAMVFLESHSDIATKWGRKLDFIDLLHTTQTCRSLNQNKDLKTMMETIRLQKLTTQFCNMMYDLSPDYVDTFIINQGCRVHNLSTTHTNAADSFVAVWMEEREQWWVYVGVSHPTEYTMRLRRRRPDTVVMIFKNIEMPLLDETQMSSNRKRKLAAYLA